VLAFAIVLPSAKVFTNLRVDECDVNDIPISSFQSWTAQVNTTT